MEAMFGPLLWQLPVALLVVFSSLGVHHWFARLNQVGVLQPIAKNGEEPRGEFHRLTELGVNCHYGIFSSKTDENGDPALIPGRIVLYLHGLGAHFDQLTWGQDGGFAQSLTDAGFSVLGLDLLGHGFSEAPDSQLSPADFQLQVDSVIAKLKLSDERLHIIGFSHGSFVASDFAARHPKSVKSLTLLAPFSCYVPGHQYSFVAALFTLLVHAFFEGNMCEPRSIFRIVLNLEGHRWPDLVRKVLEAKLPMHIVAGTSDYLVIRHARHVHSTAPGSKLLEVDGGGHMSWANGKPEHQKMIRSEIVEYLQAHS